MIDRRKIDRSAECLSVENGARDRIRSAEKTCGFSDVSVREQGANPCGADGEVVHCYGRNLGYRTAEQRSEERGRALSAVSEGIIEAAYRMETAALILQDRLYECLRRKRADLVELFDEGTLDSKLAKKSKLFLERRKMRDRRIFQDVRRRRTEQPYTGEYGFLLGRKLPCASNGFSKKGTVTDVNTVKISECENGVGAVGEGNFLFGAVYEIDISQGETTFRSGVK